jgi:hypothetical protein
VLGPVLQLASLVLVLVLVPPLVLVPLALVFQPSDSP